MVEYEEVKQGNVFPLIEEGASIEGKLVRKEAGAYGDNYVIQAPSGEEFVVLTTTVLKTKMESAKEGKNVRITFKGMVKSKAGLPYKDFKVEVEK